jgi:ubiquinone/menaquinone biosynthesis C-methylase UbiE
VEPEPYLRRAAERTAESVPVKVRVVEGTAGELPLEDGSVDAVVVAGVLCSVPDVAAALAEFARVLRAGGELRFYEHVRSERPGFARYQDTIDHVWPRLMGGCHPNRDTLAAIREAGFEVERVRRFGFPAAARAYPVLPRILGSARAA